MPDASTTQTLHYSTRSSSSLDYKTVPALFSDLMAPIPNALHFGNGLASFSIARDMISHMQNLHHKHYTHQLLDYCRSTAADAPSATTVVDSHYVHISYNLHCWLTHDLAENVVGSVMVVKRWGKALQRFHSELLLVCS